MTAPKKASIKKEMKTKIKLITKVTGTTKVEEKAIFRKQKLTSAVRWKFQ